MFFFQAFCCLLFLLVSLPIFADETIKITAIKPENGEFHGGEKVEIDGSNFGTDKNILQIYINDKSYPVENSYGNQLFFIAPKDIHSGKIFIKRNTEESNHFDIDFKEAHVTKILIPNGVQSNKTITLIGTNLQNAEVFCDTTSFIIKKSSTTEITAEFPNTALACNLSISSKKFVEDTGYKITLIPPVQFLSVETSNEGFLLHGNGFHFLKGKLQTLSLSFSGGKTLSQAEYIDEHTIRVKKNSSLAAKGNLQVKIGETLFPPLSYNFHEEIPAIISVTTPSYQNATQIYFEIMLDPSFSELKNIKVLLNGMEIRGEKAGQTLKVSLKSLPPEKGMLYTEKNGLQGPMFPYDFHYKKTPIIQKIQASSQLDQTGGILEISGMNFIPENSLKIISSLTGIQIIETSPHSIKAKIPPNIKDGKYSLSVANDSGTTTSIEFIIPSEIKKIFYPSPTISSLEYPFGPFLGKKLRIHGEGFSDGITALYFSDQAFSPNILSPTLIEVDIPKNISKTGKIFLGIQQLKTAEFPYTFFDTLKNETLIVSFPTENPSKMYSSNNIQDILSTNFQDIFSFEVLNTKKASTSTEIHFSIQEKGKEFPFTEYRLVDSQKKPIPNAKVYYDSDTSTLTVESFPILASNEKQVYFLQAKLFGIIPETISRNLSIFFLQARDDENNLISSDWDQKKSSIQIQIPASLQFSDICQERSGNGWKNCEIALRKRPQAPKQINTPIIQNTEGQTIKNTFSFSDVHQNDWFFSFMEDLFQKGILKGFNDNTARPGGNITRAELLTFLFRAQGEKIPSYATIHFSDTTNHWAKDSIEYALEKNYIKAALQFSPNKEVSRADALRMFCKMFPEKFSSPQTQNIYFTDIGTSESLKNCIAQAVNLKIVQGTSQTTFSPDNLITRAEFAKILSVFLTIK